MDASTLIAGNALPWCLGIAFLLAFPRRSTAGGAGEVAWIAGAGYLVGAFLLTVWMRVLSLVGGKFAVLPIVAPLAALTGVLLWLAWRRAPGDAAAALRAAWHALLRSPGLEGAARAAWWGALAWLAIRFTLLAVEVATRPLYPWDAWTQWATKARVWYELGGIAPFARVTAWLAANGGVYFDASPEYPPTMPLLQVYQSLLLGRWDDTLMNGSWWQTALALALVMYGGLRSLRASALAALAGAFLVSSLPLANTHVALAGYADLPLAATYVAAALALLRWIAARNVRDAVGALVLAAALTQIKNPGWFWAATLVPGFIVATWPRHGLRIVLAGFAAGAILLVALARFQLRLFNYDLKLTYAPAWGDLAESYFLLGNWHLLWYGALGVACLAWRRLLEPGLAPLTTIVVAGLMFLFVVFGFTTASYYITDQTTVNRATLHLAPLVVVFLILAWQSFAEDWNARHAQPAAA
ncbi:MAG: hypothetical protein IT522_02745 [Burkholderiales bacterium]|nr:hypothetical protein [Burkholderiales bacterium]